MKRVTECILRVPLLLSLFAAMVISCGNGNGNGNSDSTKQTYKVFSNLPFFDYTDGLTSLANVDEKYLLDQYQYFKARWVVDAPDTTINSKKYKTMRVQRDKSTDFDTVSEGIGYGMLLAVMFNDQTTFDRLYAYAIAHSNRNDEWGLMHWKVDKNGVNISEFKIPVPHREAYMYKGDWGKQDQDRKYIAATKKKYGNQYDKRINNDDNQPCEIQKSKIVSDLVNDGTIDLKAYPDGENEDSWLPACENDRKLVSATDGDMDIAMALVLASKKWANLAYEGNPTPGFDYRVEAARNIRNVLLFDFSQDAVKYPYVCNGCYLNAKHGEDPNMNAISNPWGGQAGWNPSYFCPAWIRSFKEFIQDNQNNPLVKNTLKYADVWVNSAKVDPAKFLTRCDYILSLMYTEMNKINAINGPMGLYPDWVDTQPDVPVKSEVSDRYYYSELVDMSNYMSAQYKLMSFNNYYDGVRVPWRIGMDYAWYGDSNAKNIITEIANRFNGLATTIVDGYTITGNPWVFEDRDGFNNIDPDLSIEGNPKAGGQYHTSTFVSMYACAALALPDEPNNAAAWYNETVKTYDPDKFKDGKVNPNTYFGMSLRMLSLVYLSGKMSNPERTVAVKGIRPDDITGNTYYWTTKTNEGAIWNWSGYGNSQITDDSKYKFVSLGGNDIAILDGHTGRVLRRARDTLTFDIIYGGRFIGDTKVSNVDLYDINPEAIFTVIDLGVTDDSGNKLYAFLHKATQKYVRDSTPNRGNGNGITLVDNTGTIDVDGNVKKEIAFTIETIK